MNSQHEVNTFPAAMFPFFISFLSVAKIERTHLRHDSGLEGTPVTLRIFSEARRLGPIFSQVRSVPHAMMVRVVLCHVPFGLGGRKKGRILRQNPATDKDGFVVNAECRRTRTSPILEVYLWLELFANVC